MSKNATVSTRSLFSFTMGPLTIYPLLFLPLIFWISPIAATETEVEAAETTSSARSDPLKDLKFHQGFQQAIANPPEYSENDQDSFYANQPLNLQQQPQSPQKDRYYSQSPYPYYQPMSYQPTYQNQLFNYPPQNSNPYMTPSSYSSYPTINPYMQPYYNQMPNNYQSQLYDPYVLLMQLTQSQPSKYGGYPQSLIPPQIPHQYFQSIQPGSHPFYGKPLSSLPSHDTHQLLNAIQSDPSILMSLSPPSGQTLFSSTSSSDPTSHQSSLSQSQTPHSSTQINYQPTSTSSSSIFTGLSPETQQLLSTLSNQQSYTSPFGYNDKQIRSPNEDPSEITKSPPPKAIMTTATDILGLRGGHRGKPNFNFQFSPDKQTLNRYINKNGQAHYKRKPPVFSFNSISNNRHFSFPGGLDFNIPKNHHKLKASNGTEENKLDQDCQDCTPEEPSKYISEPIVSGSALSSPPWYMIDAVMAKTKKEAKPQAHNILPHDEPAEDDKEHAPEINFQDPIHDDPIPLFVTGEEEDMYFGQNKEVSPDDNSISSIKAQIYRCPSSRDLRELSEAEIFADPLKCDQFYYCKWGRAYVFKCPVNHVFNPFSNFCERDDDFACSMTLKKK